LFYKFAATILSAKLIVRYAINNICTLKTTLEASISISKEKRASEIIPQKVELEVISNFKQ
jgi:hypothetical protein